ncbi:odorant receptor 43a-like [Harpegnathos saltator]|uniref:odorant receptor 43a-like n=1 Tax=Harpegnathos saltator TaxID=610380 RepID=UPI000DBECF7E|nr:odorant receptor 43a-like [Harpegnathos saltator]
MLLVLVLYFAIIFCLQGFLIVDVVNRKGQLSMIELLWFIAAIVYVLFNMCLYCVVGEILVTQSEKIYHATYEYPWYNKESKVAKSLMLIMLRASKPLQITAGKTFPMTMPMFCNVSYVQ